LSTTDPNEWAIEPEIQFGAARTAWLLTKYACRAIHMQVEISVLVLELQRMRGHRYRKALFHRRVCHTVDPRSRARMYM